jgi:SAM-dependent methyltransferase
MPRTSSRRLFLTRIFGWRAGLIQGDTLTADRWRWLVPQLPETRNGERLLDVGCGAGAFTIGAALRGYNALGLTWDEPDSAVAEARAGLVGASKATFSICDVRQLDERDDLFESFDFAICCENMEHILDDFKLARAIYGCLRPGGRLLLTSPFYLNRPISGYDRGPFRPVEDGWHVRRGYTRSSLAEVVESAGFVVEEFSSCSGFFSQKTTALLRLFGGRSYILGWMLILGLRPFIPIADAVFHRLFNYPRYSIGVVAYKPRLAARRKRQPDLNQAAAQSSV